jgi:hypothetical protein
MAPWIKAPADISPKDKSLMDKSPTDKSPSWHAKAPTDKSPTQIIIRLLFFYWLYILKFDLIIFHSLNCLIKADLLLDLTSLQCWLQTGPFVHWAFIRWDRLKMYNN